MELPNWVVDEVLAPARPAAFRLVVMLYRHGRPVVGSDGQRRAYWRGTTQELARLAGLDKKSVIDAERWLHETGFLTSHRPTRPNAPHAISAPFERQASGNFPPPAESETPPHGDDLHNSPWPVKSRGITTTTPPREETEEIFHRLEGLGVSSPARLLEEFGADRCDADRAAASSTLSSASCISSRPTHPMCCLWRRDWPRPARK